MNYYQTLGALLLDYRRIHNVSQLDLAARLEVDIRTVIRWEKNDTLIKPGKEKLLVEETFIPYQVIRNLNAAVPIPVYYDFKIRKYSMSEISFGLPDVEALRTHISLVSPRVQPLLESEEDNIRNILKFHRFLYKTDKPLSSEVILEAARLMPELNRVMHDKAGYYAGHCVVLPLKTSTYQRIKERQIVEGELKLNDLTARKDAESRVFYSYSIYADCNENIQFLLNEVFRISKEHPNHIFAGLAVRPDGVILLQNIGLEVLWTGEVPDGESDKTFVPTMTEGKLGQLKNIFN